jgi:outer membrane protein OmpA-like peptidoglycan-associated protein
VQSITRDAVDLHYSTQVATRTGTVQHVSVQRSVLLDDLKSATFVNPWFNTSAPRMVRGSTAIGVSSAVLRALKTKGAADVALTDRANSGLTADRSVRPNVYDYLTIYPLQRAGVVTVAVTVNDVNVDLPAIHATGSVMGDVVEMFILDDESNPLRLKSLRTSLAFGGETERTQVVKVSYRCSANAGVTPATTTPTRLEQALLNVGRAEVYGIYFAFDSDEIRKESEATLQEIAAVLNRHPDWKMGIEGHTDSIASDTYNLDLSRRRAAAVSAALTTRFGIQAGRLTATGIGEARPKDRNDTLEGRGRNRRVELVRQ